MISKNKKECITFSVKISVDKYIDKNGEEKNKFMEPRFIDSFKFMARSLDSFTRNLVSYQVLRIVQNPNINHLPEKEFILMNI